jgi:hypothetical protein
MTNKELYKAIVEGAVVTADMEAKAQELLAKQAEEASKASAKRAEKKRAEDAPLIEAVTELLRTSDTPLTASEIASANHGISSHSKATAIVNEIEGVVVGEKRIGNRMVKTYTL